MIDTPESDGRKNFQILVKNRARKQVLEDVFNEWYRRDPKTAKETIRFIKEITAQEVAAHGKYLSDEDPNAEVTVSIRFPATLMWALRRVWPTWGDDSKDLIELIELFPEIVPREMRNRLKSKRCRGNQPPRK